jgi:hypothetical protein
MWYIDRTGPFSTVSNIAGTELALITDEELKNLFINSNSNRSVVFLS